LAILQTAEWSYCSSRPGKSEPPSSPVAETAAQPRPALLPSRYQATGIFEAPARELIKMIDIPCSARLSGIRTRIYDPSTATSAVIDPALTGTKAFLRCSPTVLMFDGLVNTLAKASWQPCEDKGWRGKWILTISI
jgi:hypothetical protein